MRCEACLSDREIVCDERRGGLQQPRIVRRGLDEARPCLIRTGRIAGSIELIGEQTPPVRKVGHERNGTAQCRDRLRASIRFREGGSELEEHGADRGLLACQGLEHLEGGLRLAGDPLCGAEDEPSVRVPGRHL
jgi:hypothetical protein